MNYGYIRVSSDKQVVDNQRFEIVQFAKANCITVDGWIEETISGTKDYAKRELGKLLQMANKGDLIVCTELSRLGRNLFMIVDILNVCTKKGCVLWTIKDNYRLGDDMSSKVLAFAFGLSAEIERALISQRTKEALARKRHEGIVLGRPKGAKTNLSKTKCYQCKDKIVDMIASGSSYAKISRELDIGRNTVSKFVRFDLSEN